MRTLCLSLAVVFGVAPIASAQVIPLAPTSTHAFQVGKGSAVAQDINKAVDVTWNATPLVIDSDDYSWDGVGELSFIRSGVYLLYAHVAYSDGATGPSPHAYFQIDNGMGYMALAPRAKGGRLPAGAPGAEGSVELLTLINASVGGKVKVTMAVGASAGVVTSTNDQSVFLAVRAR